MNFNSYYLYAKKFVEETVNAKDKADKPFVEEYMEEILHKELYNLEEEDLKSLIYQLSCTASFYARLRRTVMNHTGRIMLERMMDEADFEAEFEQELKHLLEEE